MLFTWWLAVTMPSIYFTTNTTVIYNITYLLVTCARPWVLISVYKLQNFKNVPIRSEKTNLSFRIEQSLTTSQNVPKCNKHILKYNKHDCCNNIYKMYKLYLKTFVSKENSVSTKPYINIYHHKKKIIRIYRIIDSMNNT